MSEQLPRGDAPMDLWNAVCETDPAITKEIPGGAHLTAIDTYSRIQKATEVFGPAGRGWGWEIRNILEISGSVVVQLHMWVGPDDKGYGCVGQCDLLQGSRDNKYPDGECVKKALTDGITKGLSYIGMCVDIWLKKHKDSKYVQEMRDKFSNPSTGHSSAPESTNAEESTPDTFDLDSGKKALFSKVKALRLGSGSSLNDKDFIKLVVHGVLGKEKVETKEELDEVDTALFVDKKFDPTTGQIIPF